MFCLKSNCKKILFFYSFIVSFIANSQTVSFFIYDEENKPIEGVYVYFEERANTKVTDEKGHFSINNFKKNEKVSFSKLGYKTLVLNSLEGLSTIVLKLDSNLSQLSEVVVKRGNDLKSVASGKIVLNADQLKRQPYLLGEQDIFKIIQLEPGVQQAKEGQSGFLVRGGNSSMNLTLIDNFYLHNTAHLGGFFSAVNSDFVNSVVFSKSAFDSKFGGRLASVTQINTKNKPEGNDEFDANIGFLTTKFTGNLEASEQTQVLFSVRRTYLELFEPFFKDSETILGSDRNYYFYDFLFKVSHDFDEKNTLELLKYSTYDQYEDFSDEKNRIVNWNNQVNGITWKHKFSANFRSEHSMSFSEYGFQFAETEFPYEYDFSSDLELFVIKNNFSINREKWFTNFGIEFSNNKINPKRINALVFDTVLNIENQIEINFKEYNGFVDFKYDFTKKLKAKLGVRFGAMFLQENALMQSTNFINVEPRFNANYLVNDNNSFKFSYQFLNQYLHQASVSSFSLPLDYMLISNNFIKPQTGSLTSVSWVNSNTIFDFTISGYFNFINNYSEFKSGAINTLFSNNIYEDVVQGKLQSYGLELSLKGEVEKIDYSISTTISKTEAQFSQINNGNPFRTTFDRPLNFNFLANYNVNSRFNLGIAFTLNSGENYTPPLDVRIIDESTVINYGIKNSESFPNYHRLDLSATYSFKTKKNFNSKLNLTIYNAYNNKNPFLISYNIVDAQNSTAVKINKENEYLFPVIPTLNWIFSF